MCAIIVCSMGCQTFLDLKEITKPWKYNERRTYYKIRAQEIYPCISSQILRYREFSSDVLSMPSTERGMAAYQS